MAGALFPFANGNDRELERAIAAAGKDDVADAHEIGGRIKKAECQHRR